MFSFFTFLAVGGINPEQIIPGINKTPISALTDVTGGTSSIVGWLITTFWIVAIGFIVWSAFLYLGAAGDEERLTKAKSYLKYAIIAAVVATLATGIQIITLNLLMGGGNSHTCTSNADCSGGLSCVNNICINTGYICNPSRGDFDCPSGEHCVNGFCQ